MQGINAETLTIIVEKLTMDWHQRRLRFHGMKYFVSYHETVRFKRRNTSFHPVKRTDTKLLPLQGQVYVRNYPGRCPGLGASALSGRAASDLFRACGAKLAKVQGFALLVNKSSYFCIMIS